MENIKPSQTLSLIWKNFLANSKILDLGCGQGDDSLFLAKNGFAVVAVDSSNVIIDQLKIKKNKFNLDNLELVCDDINNFYIAKNQYQVIICRNVLNFLDKVKALEIIKNLQDNIQKDAYIILEVFTKNDPSFFSDKQFTSYFEEQELLKIFTDYKLIYYLENIILDPGHPDFSVPHKHGVSRIIVQK